jgi:hypothetical protein
MGDDVAPSIGNVLDNGTTNDTAPLVGGTLTSGLNVGETVYVYRDNVKLGAAITTSLTWSYADSGLANGNTYVYTARVEDLALNQGPLSGTYTITIDTVNPTQTVTITSMGDDVAPSIGNVPSGGTTNDVTPLVGGTLTSGLNVGETVYVYRDNVKLGAATTTSLTWSYADSGLANGSAYVYTARVEDLALNQGPLSGTYTITIDTVNPTQTVTITSMGDDVAPSIGNVLNNGTTNDTAPLVGGTLTSGLNVGETVYVYRDNVKLGAATTTSLTWSYADSGLANGSAYVYTARVEDLALNQGPLSGTYTITIDTVNPTQTVTITSMGDDVAPSIGNVLNNGTTNDTAPLVGGTLTSGLNVGETVYVYRDGVKLGAATTTSLTWSYADSGLSNGNTYVYTARVEDLALNQGPLSGTYTITIDTVNPTQTVTITAISDDVAPVFGPVVNGGYTNDTAPLLLGTLSASLAPGELVAIYRDGTRIGNGAVTGTAWTFGDSGLSDGGAYSYTAQVEDAALNLGTLSATYSIHVDTSAPLAPTTLAYSVDTGVVGDGITGDNDLVITGSAEAGSQVQVFDGALLLGTVTTDGGGKWTLPSTGTLADGKHTFTATATDAAGNGSASSAPLPVVIDTSAPLAPTTLTYSVDTGVVGDGITGDNDLVITGSAEAGSKVQVFDGALLLGTVTTDGGGKWTLPSSGTLADGKHTFTATATDAAGNGSASSAPLPVVIDTSAPLAPTTLTYSVDTGVVGDGITGDNDLVITGSAEAGSKVQVFDGALLLGTVTTDGGGKWTLPSTGTLADGKHTFTAIATDAAGNGSVSSAPLPVVIDTANPLPPTITMFMVDTGTLGDGLTADNDLMIHGTAEPGSMVRILDGAVTVGMVVADGAGQWILASTGILADGPHVFTATATDAAANGSGPSAPFPVFIDTSAPFSPLSLVYSLDTGVLGDGVTGDNDLTIDGAAEPGSTVRIYDGSTLLGTVVTDGGGHWNLPSTGPLADGTHVFTATATDGAGNTSAPSNPLPVIIDTKAPLPPTTSGYSNDTGVPGDGITGDNDLTLTGTAEPGSRVWIYEGSTLIGSAPVDGAGKWTLPSTGILPDGKHVFTVFAVDPAGNQSPGSNPLEVTIDTVPPQPPGVSFFSADTGVLGDGITADNDLVLHGTAEPGSMVEVFDGATSLGMVATGPGGVWSLGSTGILTDGDHVFRALAGDAAGNWSAPSANFPVQIDTTAPASPLLVDYLFDTGVVGDGITADNDLLLTGTAEANSRVMVFDGVVLLGTVTADAAGNFTLASTSPLADGKHAFTATATDAAGNTSVPSVSLDVVVDTQAPVAPVITSFTSDTGVIGDGITADNDLILTGTAEPGSMVEIFNGAGSIGFVVADAAGTWTLPSTGTLADGKHTFTAVATDNAGNASVVSVPLNVMIDATSPLPPVISGFTDDTGVVGDGITTDNNLALFGTGEPGALVEIFDGSTSLGIAIPNPAGDWALASTGLLADGLHVFSAVATDAAGNVSPPSAILSVVVDRTPPPAPLITRIDDDTAIPTDRITSDNTLTATGFTGPGSIVRIYDGAVLVGETVADPLSGAYSVTTIPLADGSHPITVRAVDSAGNEGAAADGGVWLIDTLPPIVPQITSFEEDTPTVGDHVTTDRDLVLRGSGEPGSLVTVELAGTAIGTATVNPSGAWTLPSTGALGLGNQSFVVRATDVAGNVSTDAPPYIITTVAIFTAATPQQALFIIDIFGSSNLVTTNGSVPLLFEVIGGTLPPGLVMDSATGRLSGAATQLGVTVLSVRVTDIHGQQVEIAVDIRVDPAINSMLVSAGQAESNNLNQLSPSMVNPLSFLNGTAVTLWGSASPDPGSQPHAVGQVVPYVGYTGAVSVFLAELNDDGRPDAITGAGPGAPPHVTVIDVQSGNALHSFYAFDPAFKGGISVSAGDFNNDGFKDIIVVSGPGARTHVKVFDSRDLTEIASFYPFEAGDNSNGGASASVGDIDGDGLKDLIIGAAPGTSPYVSIFDTGTLALKKRFLAYDAAFLGGINVSAGDLKGDGVEEIAVGSNNTEAHVTVWSAKSGELLNSFYAYGQNDGGPAFKGGVRVGLVAYAQQEVDVLVTGAGPSSLPHARVWSFSVPTYVESFYVAPVDDTRGVKVG